MTITELMAALSRVQQVIGDADVVLDAIEGGAETVIHAIGLELEPGGTSTTGTVSLKHGAPTPPAPTPPPPAPAPTAD